MLLEILWAKLKLAWPRAGLKIPSIFCSTQGPRSVLVVVPVLIVCHGQANLIAGRWTLMPTKCRAAESAISTTDAIARRDIRPTGACGARMRDRASDVRLLGAAGGCHAAI